MKKSRAHFPSIPAIAYEGPGSANPLAFHHYNPDEIIDGRPLAAHLRFSIAYWHSFRGTGSDPFGTATIARPWDRGRDALSVAKARMDAAFEFFQKIRAPFYCFHDRDIAPEGRTLAESNRHLDVLVAHAAALQQATGVKLLWGTANLFSHPRYMCGAATNPDAHVFAYAAAQVKKALEVTHQLGGENYVFWGGREGYETLLNTNLKREQDHLAAFLHLAVDHAKAIGFQGQFLIEPKPKEPTKHQYDFDVASGIAFLRTYGLEKHFKFNIETNHATLAGHTFQHEIEVAAAAGLLGSIDANDPPRRRPRPRRLQLRRQAPPPLPRSRRSLPRPHRRHGCLRPRLPPRPPDPRRRQVRTLRAGTLRQLRHRLRPRNRTRSHELPRNRETRPHQARRAHAALRPTGVPREPPDELPPRVTGYFVVRGKQPPSQQERACPPAAGLSRDCGVPSFVSTLRGVKPLLQPKNRR